MKKVLFSLISATFLLAEPSAFEAGNLDSPNPYGLTKDEKYILANKKNIQKLQKIILKQQNIINQNQKTTNNLKLKIVNFKLKLNLLSQKIDGINTVIGSIDGVNQKVSNLKQELNSTNAILFSLKDNFNKLQEVVNDNKKATDDNINTVIGLTEQIAKSVDALKQKLNKIKNKVDFTTWSKKDIFNKAIYYFNNKNYAKSQKMFDYLYKNNYKSATSLFYLGEIEYKLGNYKNALAFYKKSIQKYPKKTRYMAQLLYHTGYSLERLSQKIAAKKSYLKIIKDYPKSIFVKYAKKRLNNLEKIR